MSMRPGNFAFRTVVAGLIVTAVASAAPVSTERWHILKFKNGWTARVDLDSLKREADEVTYRAEFTVVLPDGAVKRGISLAVIDCAKGRRKGLETEQFRPDGSSRKGSIDLGWRTIQPKSATDSIRQVVCARGMEAPKN